MALRVSDHVTFHVGTRVREIEGRHIGTVIAVFSSRSYRIQWDDTGWKTDCDEDDICETEE